MVGTEKEIENMKEQFWMVFMLQSQLAGNI
jgi:hypothetical protein